MGNAIGGRRRTARVMTVDGTTYKYRPPAVAGATLRDHPGYQLLESEEVRRLGMRARPLDVDAPLKPGKLYFLVELPRLAAAARAPRRTWSGALVHVGGGGAGERLESMMLSRRSASDVAASVMMASPASSVEAGEDGAVRLRMRLPKAEVARLVKESRDAAEAAEKIMQLCVARDHRFAPATPVLRPPLQAALVSSDKKKVAEKKQKKARFVTDVPDEIIGF
ncbi:hypothetical protein E2562_015950 [Oryza meyeriana var. granulata]|uniref:Uncharacterized protein n=1 Tax=Oryza meyeriana var. granulata TaxID=110450 RepID=A0A6G1CF98_9ORYZ|nr:hypothetical protein E2562_015950 [Oryza meyeriana var. granulata]